MLQTINAVLGTILTAICAIYAVLAYHTSKGSDALAARKSKIRTLFASRRLIISLLFVGVALLVTSWIQETGSSDAGARTYGRFYGPSALEVQSMDARLRDPKTDIPFLVNIHFRADKDLVDETGWGYLLVTTGEISTSMLDSDFQPLHGLLMAVDADSLSNLPANENRFLSVLATNSLVVTDDDIKAVTSDSRDIYVLFSWRYRLPDDSRVFLKDFCAFYEGNFSSWHYCPGRHNATFIVQ